MKLLLVIVEGHLYLAGILAIFVAELAFLFWGLWSRRPIIGLIAVFGTLPLIRSTLSAIRACFFRIEPPQGLSLARTEGRALFDLVEEIRRAVDAPPVDSVTITIGFNASAMAYSSLWPPRRRRTLALGFPVLATLSTAELRAVIAHELAHFSSAHDPYAAWVYRTHRSWIALRRALDQRLATPVYVYWFIRWYVPRLYAASADLARHHEFVADAVAAKVAGSRATADALVVIESGARFEDRVHWPQIEVCHEQDAERPRPYSRMLTWNARAASTEMLDEVLSSDNECTTTHPSMRERLARLGETGRRPPPVDRSAGEELLGPELARLADRHDRRWMTENGEAWQRRRAEYVDRSSRLARLAAVATPTPDDLFQRAELVETLEGEDEALPIYQAAADQGHPAASLAAGRVLLVQMDAAGVSLVEAAMDRDDRLVPEGCRILADYYRETNQQLAARKCEWRATRHTTQARLAQKSHTLDSEGSSVT
jgi:Zn-dependent protease with chaperone function